MWGTAKYRKIESADMEGTNRSVIVDNTRHIFGFSLGGESVVSTNYSELAGLRVNHETYRHQIVLEPFTEN